MYRLLIFLVLLNLADCGHCRNKSHNKERNPEDVFRKLAHQSIWTEKKFANSYRHNMWLKVREVYGTNGYTLKYSIPDFKANDITVKVLHKAVYVSGDCSAPKKSLRDVKMLPDNLNAEEASWCLQNGELEITFPYKTPLGHETSKSCGDINYSVITVPMAQPVIPELPCTGTALMPMH